MSATAADLREDIGPAFETEWAENEADFAALAPEWDALVDRAGSVHPFVRHDWLDAWWHAFSGDARMRVLTVRADGRLVGAAALMLAEHRLYGIPVRVLQSMAGDHTPRFDFVVDPAFAPAVHDALWSAIAVREGEWDLLKLRQLPEDSGTLEAVRSRAEAAGCETGLWAGDRSPYLRFTGTWNRYYDSLSYNHRKNVGKGRRRLERQAPLSLEIVTDPDDLGARIRDGMRIEARAWKAKAGTAMASQSETRRFYLGLARRLAAQGMLRLHFLRHGSEHIAFSFGILHRDTIFVLKGGYEPKFAKFTPYNVMCSMILEQGHAAGLAGYDFLGDADPWKKQWARTARQHHWLYVCSDGFRARYIHFLKFQVVPNVQSARKFFRQFG